jgi:gliding motility-associated-like protein
MQGWDTLKQAKPNRYSGLTVTPGVYKHVYKKANRYFPTFQLRNTEGCFGPRNKEVDVGFYWNWTFSDSIICHGNTEITLHDSIRYFAYEDPFVWLDPKAYWMDPNRFVKLREWKKIDFNEHDDSLKANQFNTTGIGIPPFKWHYDDPGIYNIRIAMKDSLGCMDTARQRVYVTGVKAGFKVLNGSGLSCKNIISFKDTSVVIDPCVADKGKPCDNIVEYTWDFGDGKRQSKLKDPSHDFTQNGSFTIKLKVKTKLGCEDSTSFVITINGPRPYFNPISDTIVCAGDSVIFDNQSYDPLFSPQWEWNFGDGKVFSDNVKRPVGHRYTTPGTYKVYLTQFDNINGTSIRCSAIYPDTSADQIVKIERIVKVKPVAPASFDIAPNDTVCPNDLVSYTSNSDTIYKRFMWRFGDGDTINTNTPSASHSFKKPGTYTTTMIPDYDTPEFHKCLDTTKKSIVVVDVFADFSIDDKDAPTFCFTNKSVGGTKYSWKFEDPRGDGSSTDVDPCYTWQDTGCYDVTLTVTNDIGCTDDTTQQVCYKFVSKIIPYNVFTPEPKDGFNDVFRVNAEGLDKFDIVIYNRWGEVVFESKDQFFTWNGKVKNTGADCPEGTYFYIMNYKIRNKPVNDGLKGPVSGTVTLIRGK